MLWTTFRPNLVKFGRHSWSGGYLPSTRPNLRYFQKSCFTNIGLRFFLTTSYQIPLVQASLLVLGTLSVKISCELLRTKSTDNLKVESKWVKFRLYKGISILIVFQKTQIWYELFSLQVWFIGQKTFLKFPFFNKSGEFSGENLAKSGEIFTPELVKTYPDFTCEISIWTQILAFSGLWD